MAKRIKESSSVEALAARIIKLEARVENLNKTLFLTIRDQVRGVIEWREAIRMEQIKDELFRLKKDVPEEELERIAKIAQDAVAQMNYILEKFHAPRQKGTQSQKNEADKRRELAFRIIDNAPTEAFNLQKKHVVDWFFDRGLPVKKMENGKWHLTYGYSETTLWGYINQKRKEYKDEG